MELNLKSLQETGAFTGAPVEKEIKWEQDDKEYTATTFVRKLSYGAAVSDANNMNGDMIAGRIAACICDKEGKDVFTIGDITGEVDIKRGPLNYNLTLSLLGAIAEVNYPSGKRKAQRKKKNSGTN